MRNTQSSQKKAIKEKIISQLKEEDLQQISFTDKENILWEEEGKEFLFNGEMYDVVKTDFINGKVLLYCINDKIEKALIDNYNFITKHNSSSDKKAKNALDNSINLFVYADANNKEQYSIRVVNKFYAFDSCLLENIMDNFCPPPEV